MSTLFEVIGDPSRRRMLDLLRDDEHTVNELVDALDMSQPAVSHQLRILRQARLVRGRRAGRETFYRLDDHHVLTLLSEGLKHVGHHGDV